jgi:cytoskeletal protein CcmA (bactofilin family)
MFSSRKAAPPAFDNAYQATSFEEDDSLPQMQQRADNAQRAQPVPGRSIGDPDVLAQTEMARQYASEVAAGRGVAQPGVEGQDAAMLCIGKAIKMKGSVEDCGVLQVDGQFEASAQSRFLKVSETGIFVGDADVHSAEIVGRFDGNITVKDKLVIRSTGVVTGTVRYGNIEIADGGRISGDIQAILKNEPPAQQQQPNDMVNQEVVDQEVSEVPVQQQGEQERKPLRLNLADTQPELSDTVVPADSVAQGDSVAPADTVSQNDR